MTTQTKKPKAATLNMLGTPKHGLRSAMGAKHQTQIGRGQKLMEALLILASPAAEKLRTAIGEEMAATATAVAAGDQAMKAMSELGRAWKQSSRDLQSATAGTVALARQLHPALFAKLPSAASFAPGDPMFAEQLGQGLISAGGSSAALGKGLVATREKELADAQAYQKAVDGHGAVQQGRAALSNLAALFHQAEALIHSTAKPGSPVYAVLKSAKRTKKVAVAAEATTPAAPALPVTKPAPTPGSTYLNGTSQAPSA